MPPEQLDPDAVNLAKAIRQTESGGNFAAKGKSGEYGAYQFTEPTWNTYAKKHGVNVPLTQATPAQQNEVAYRQIKEWKDQGLNPGQIASMWNSGKPDAYLDQNYKGVNKSGVQYDVPAYARSVAAAYHQIKAGGIPGADPNNPSSIANTSPVQEQPQQKDFLQRAGDVVNSIFPGKAIGQSIGTLAGYIASPNKDTYDLSAPTPLQTTADAAQAALTVGAGVPGAGPISAFGKTLPGIEAAGSIAGRIAQSAAVGAGVGATGAVARGGGLEDASKQGLAGAAFGAGAGAAGEIVNQVAQYVPKWIARSYIRGANDETIAHAVNKGLDTPAKMLTKSDSSLTTLGNKLRTELSSPENSYVQPSGVELLTKVADEFPNSGLTAEDVADNLKKLVPLQKNLVDKLVKGDISLVELHELNSNLGSAVYKRVFDEPTVRAGKDIGNEFYHTASSFIKEAAPGSAEIFDEFTKEIPLNAALQKLARSGTSFRLTMKDLATIMALAHTGLLPTVGGVALERLLTSPGANLKVAGLLSKLPQAAQAARGLLPLAARGVSGVVPIGQTKQ